MLILGIDTSGKTASAALYDSQQQIVLAQNTIYTKLTHSQVILPVCKKLMSDADIKLSDVDIIAVSEGPGSYTGLRIGIAAVKAMAFALDCKCCGISTLESLAYNCLGFKGVIVSVMKARLNLVYAGIFESDGKFIKRLSDDEIISTNDLCSKLLSFKSNIIFTGDFAKDFTNLFPENNFLIAPPHLRLQLASSLCLKAAVSDSVTPDMLSARYLQPTKAEKDLQSD